MGNWALQAAVESWFTLGNGDALLFDEIILPSADERYDTLTTPSRPAQRPPPAGNPHLNLLQQG
jgi:hypothetical protein